MHENEWPHDTPARLLCKTRARRLVELRRDHLAVLAELEAAGCAFRGRVLRRHRLLSHELDRVEAAFQDMWKAAA